VTRERIKISQMGLLKAIKIGILEYFGCAVLDFLNKWKRFGAIIIIFLIR